MNSAHSISRSSTAHICFPVILALMLVSAPAAQAENLGRTWVALDAQPQGTPAQITLDPNGSSRDISAMRVQISGFWVTPVQGPDGHIYHGIDVPGLSALTQIGAPRLPAAKFELGIVTAAQQPFLAGQQDENLLILPGYHVYPKPIETVLHDGTDPEFVRDDAIYCSVGFWPPQLASSPFPVQPLYGFLPSAEVVLYPLRWDPATDDLEVHANTTYYINHQGPLQQLPEITTLRSDMMSSQLLNWSVIAPDVPANLTRYAGEYLFVYKASYKIGLQPLIDQKKARGFSVTELTTEAIGHTCPEVRAAIRDWYNLTGTGPDHFCLLVGDSYDIEACQSGPVSHYPAGVITDDLYGSPTVGTLDKEVLVGRLSVEVPAELPGQVAKILAYEDTPPSGAHFNEVVLGAHRDIIKLGDIEDRIKYWQELIRTATYSKAPTFRTVYGDEPGASNAALSASINAGAGLVSFLGHGGSLSWSSWNNLGEDYDYLAIPALTNAPHTPVVWSFACQTAFLTAGRSVCQEFMAHGPNGSVASYGPTADALAWDAADLDLLLFRQVYNLGHTLQGYAYAAAERTMELYHKSGESWKFLLLGDPQMTIRRTNPPPLKVSRPDVVQSCGPGCPQLAVHVTSAEGSPIPGAKVAMWKPSIGLNATPARADGRASAQSQDELLDNRYTDANGLALIPAPDLADGVLYYTVEGPEGFAMRDSVKIVNGETLGSPVGVSAPPRLAAAPSVTRARTRFLFGRRLSSAARLRLFDSSGRLVRALQAREGDSSLSWDGRDDSGAEVAPGVYMARLEVDGTASATRVVVLR